jgi:hypothetical protein
MIQNIEEFRTGIQCQIFRDPELAAQQPHVQLRDRECPQRVARERPFGPCRSREGAWIQDATFGALSLEI